MSCIKIAEEPGNGPGSPADLTEVGSKSAGCGLSGRERNFHFLQCRARGAILSSSFPTQTIHTAQLAPSGKGQVHQSRITRPYPNFLFLGRKGTPSFPPSASRMLTEERSPPVAAGYSPADSVFEGQFISCTPRP